MRTNTNPSTAELQAAVDTKTTTRPKLFEDMTFSRWVVGLQEESESYNPTHLRIQNAIRAALELKFLAGPETANRYLRAVLGIRVVDDSIEIGG